MSFESREHILTIEEPYKEEIMINIFDLKGNLEENAETLEQLEKEILSGFEESNRFIFFNLSQVTGIGESFWVSCIKILKKAYEFEGCFSLTNPTTSIVDSLRHFRLQNIFELHGNEKKAIKVLETELRSQMIPFN